MSRGKKLVDLIFPLNCNKPKQCSIGILQCYIVVCDNQAHLKEIQIDFEDQKCSGGNSVSHVVSNPAAVNPFADDAIMNHEEEEGQDFDSDDSILDRNYIPSEDKSSGNNSNILVDEMEAEADIPKNDDSNELQREDEGAKRKLTRKRLRDSESWKKNIRKKRRNLGLAYTSAKGKEVCGREMKEVCFEKCRLKCSTRIFTEERKAIFDYLWMLGNIKAQRVYINSCMTEVNPTYRNPKPGSNQSKNFTYSLTVESKKIQVCKTYFKNTLAINNRVIFTTSKKRDQQGMIDSDRRGKSNKDRISDKVKNDIRNHIGSFPTVSSHYCRARTNKFYLDGCLNIQTMYRLYVERCKTNHREYAKVTTYRHILNTETNLQSVLPTPCGDVNFFYYKRKLATYNFTIFDVKNKEGHCYLWHEGIAKRGANEIYSCVYKFISKNENENLVFYSDNCVGQNKNKFVFGMYLYCIKKIENIKSITHKFLIVGHTQNEGDSMHASIEREKKRVLKSGPIYVPSQWSMVVRNAKKQGKPYKVDEISTNDVLDFKKIISKIGNNFSLNSDKEKVIWRDVKIVRVEKAHPNIIFYKTSFDQLSPYKHIQIKNSLRHSSVTDLTLTPAYTRPPPISRGKKQHLLEMCKENAILEVHWPFYKNLEASNAISESESDNEEQ
ncbi:hypothetical protein RN001_001417 [Aquatica leii]|uniref:DUF7869 domain-containing protein n=1 Tax=Aquatica leii TaxID=1421715 RepID=A0AAN7PL71_9COLE|nr:hypothetical protein RN001_001417 [Aquatica leii]